MKKTQKQDMTLFIPIGNLLATWKGDTKKLPPNKTYELVIDYPFGGERIHRLPIKTGKSGMSILTLLGKIGQAYDKIYEEPEENGVFGHDMDDLSLEGITINHKTKKIELSIGS